MAAFASALIFGIIGLLGGLLLSDNFTLLALPPLALALPPAFKESEARCTDGDAGEAGDGGSTDLSCAFALGACLPLAY